MLKTLEMNNIKVLIANFYNDEYFREFEKEDVDALFVKNPGLYISKNPEAYKEEILDKIKEDYGKNNIFYLFELNGKLILICDSRSYVEEVLKFMKQAKVEYCLDLEKQILYFNGIIMDRKFVNTLRKKLNLEVLKFNEVWKS